MSSRLCPFCMKTTESDVCSHCGRNTVYAGMPLHLPAGFVVHGRRPYVLGAALGQGGFGITYIALDMETGERVAVKEYFPTYCAGRTGDHSVISYPNQEEVFRKGKERFLDEARVLKSLSDLNSIVNVLDFFEFNNSAYLVMEFLEGDSLKSHAQKHGKFPAQEFLQKLRPLMEDIERMHQRGVVHRDIAPDNIILTPDGQMKLIDFGAARSYVGDQSMTVVVKKGFAPIEQYMRKGSSAYTDVYALAATIYYCITGVVPPDSAERQYEGAPLQDPAALGAVLSQMQKIALGRALVIQPQNRTQSIAAFLRDLDSTSEPEKPKPVYREIKTEAKQTEAKQESPVKKSRIVPAVAAVLLCVVGAVLFMGREKALDPPAQITVPENTVPETEPPVILSEEAQKYNEAVDFFNSGEYGKAAIAFAKLGDYRDARESSLILWNAMTAGDTIRMGDSAGNEYIVGLKRDGTVVAAGENEGGRCDVSDWTDIVAISAGYDHTIGLKKDGTVVAVGSNKNGKCNVSGWTDIVAISAGTSHTIGLKADGTVMAVGHNGNGQCDVSGWTDVVDIITGNSITVGLRADGRAVATGWNSYGQCDVSGWRDVVDISAHFHNTFGLKTDGTVEAVGENLFGECDVSGWTDIVAISTGLSHTVGLKADGTVVAVGFDLNGSCDVSDWTDIVAISAGQKHTVSLKADGTVMAVGENEDGQCDVSGWTDIVEIFAGYNHTVGLKADGTVVIAGKNDYNQYDASSWTDIRLPTIPEERLSEINLSYITEE